MEKDKTSATLQAVPHSQPSKVDAPGTPEAEAATLPLAAGLQEHDSVKSSTSDLTESTWNTPKQKTFLSQHRWWVAGSGVVLLSLCAWFWRRVTVRP